LAALTLLLVVAPSPADWTGFGPYVDGETTPYGYVYRSANGYWWLGGVPYTRQYSAGTAACYSRGCYYAGTGPEWIYTRANYTAPATVNNTVTNIKYSPNWQTESFQVMVKRDDLTAYQNTFDKLNAGAIPSTSGGIYAGANYGGYTVTGTTLYQRGGYNHLSAAYYNALDVNLMNQGTLRALGTAQDYLKDAHGKQLEVAREFNEGARQVAVINALAAASQPPPVSQQTQLQLQPTAPVAPASPLMPQATDPGSPQRPASGGLTLDAIWNDPGPDGCVKCHSGANAAKGFTLEKYKSLSRQQKIDLVYDARLDPPSKDPKAYMPRDANGVGHQLPKDKLYVFYLDILNMPVGGK
jgi:hypothetical protein